MGEYDSSVRCPICGGEAELGRLYGGDPAALKWLPGSQSLFLGAWAFGSTAVGRSGWGLPSGRARAEGIYCGQCRRIVIDATVCRRGKLALFLQHLLLVTATIVGACSGLWIVAQYHVATGIMLGFPCCGFVGRSLGWGLLKRLGCSPRTD
jgi:hypothetical protein